MPPAAPSGPVTRHALSACAGPPPPTIRSCSAPVCDRFLLLGIQPEKCPVVVARQEGIELCHYARFRGLVLVHVIKHHGPDEHLTARVLDPRAFRLSGPLLGLLFLLERLELFQLLFLRLDA